MSPQSIRQELQDLKLQVCTLWVAQEGHFCFLYGTVFFVGYRMWAALLQSCVSGSSVFSPSALASGRP